MKAFDYVVVGGGTAGSVLAARLSADPAVSVLLLEAGPAEPRDVASMRTPWAFPRLFGSEVDWAFETEPSVGGARHQWARGKVLGGSSAINAMAHLRGHPSNYDGWRDSGAAGWGYADLLPYFRKSESTSGRDPLIRGETGPVHVVADPGATAEQSPLVEGVRQAGLGFTDDISGARPEGAFWFEFTRVNGQRQTAADAYLEPVADRANLSVVTEALVRRVLFDGTVATGVEYEHGGGLMTASAEREVILAAGAVSTPHLLLLSGIGPAKDLRAMDVAVRSDLPGVGRNLQDHYQSYLLYRSDRPMPNNPGGVGYGSALLRTPLATDAPDIQLLLWARPVLTPPDDGTGHYFTFSVALLSPHSRGRITLRSSDPHDHPRIETGYLEDPRDIATLTAGFQLTREVATTRAFAPWHGVELLPGADLSTSQMESYLRSVGSTYYHPAGTAKIGSDQDSVVDPNLRVHGVEQLRVADASVMPTVTTANTNATVLAIAERAADLIMQARR